MLTRTERHIVVKDNNLRDLCFKSKNLYNYVNYILRQAYFNKEKKPNKYELVKKLTVENQLDFRALPSNVSQQIIFQLYKNWDSFWKLIKDYNKNPSKYNGVPKIPKFKHKEKGLNLLIFTKSECRINKDGLIYFNRKSNIKPLKTKVLKDQLQQVRIIPQATCFVIEVIYKIEQENLNLDNENVLSIDLGINNFATLTNNVGQRPTIINGKTIKSMNQFYNKKYAVLKSYVGNKSSNRVKKLVHKRNNKITDSLHKTSRFIINYCTYHNIGTIIVGYNEGWKNEINLGKKTNQKFVNIPYLKFIQQLQYKAENIGIQVILNEESYTSKCDALALESLSKQEKYLGKRKFRGLFVSSIGRLINADVNGSLNIGRKVIGDKFVPDRGVGLTPLRINIESQKYFNKLKK